MTSPQSQQAPATLLDRRRDPAPVSVNNRDSAFPLLLVCEHAGRAIPVALGDLGVPEAARADHIGLDIGAGPVSEDLAQRLGCTLISQNYSRLVIDCNRPPGTAGSIPETSDTVPVPGNRNLDPAARTARFDEIFAPFAEACHTAVTRPGLRAMISIHSYTPRLAADLIDRPWDIGFLYRAPHSRGDDLADLCARLFPDLTIGRNAPYRIEPESDWFIPVCAEATGKPHCLIEIRNDHINSPHGCAHWAERLATLLTGFLEICDAPDT